MYVHLFAAQWLTVVNVLGDELPQVQSRIADACNGAGGETVVAVEGRTEGWSAVAERLSVKHETADIARVVRLMVTAANVEW